MAAGTRDDPMPPIFSRQSLDSYCQNLLELEPAAHHRLINAHLEKVERGEIKRLMIFAPPGHAKSTYATVAFPGWFMGRNRDKGIICASHEKGLAEGFSRRVRNWVNSEEYYEIFDLELARDSKSVSRWQVQYDDEGRERKGAEYYAVGVDSSITGRRADGGIIDDPVKGRKEADSETVRESTWQWYLSDFRTRLKPGSFIIIIQTRWHQDDLSGRILPADYDGGSGWYTAKDGEKWYVLSLPALARENDIMGRKVGEALWPKLDDGTPWYTAEVLEQEKRTQGARNFSALYQQTPSEEEGEIIKRSWWRKWPGALPPKILYLIQSYDTAFSEETTADYSARTTWGIFDYQDFLKVLAETEGIEIPEEERIKASRIKYATILLERFNERLAYPELRREATRSNMRYHPDRIIIEKKASGQSLIQDLRKAGLPVTGIKLDKFDDKISRANTASIVPESGCVFYMDRDWAKSVIDQCAVFPNGEFDDMVDTCTQAWAYLYRRFWLNIADEEDNNPYNAILKAQQKSRDSRKRYYGSSAG